MMSMSGSNRGMTLLLGCSGSRCSPSSSCGALRTRFHVNGMANGMNCNACWIAFWSDAVLSGS